jgi:hypothetical protein
LIFTEFDERLTQDAMAVAPPERQAEGSLATYPFNLNNSDKDQWETIHVHDSYVYFRRQTMSKEVTSVVDVAKTILVLDLSGMNSQDAQKQIDIALVDLKIDNGCEVKIRNMTDDIVDGRSVGTSAEPSSGAGRLERLAAGPGPMGLDSMRRLLIVSDTNRTSFDVTWKDDAIQFLSKAQANAEAFGSLNFVVCTSAKELHLHLNTLMQTDTLLPILPFDTNALVHRPPRIQFGRDHCRNGVLTISDGVFTQCHAWSVIAGTAKRTGMTWLDSIRRQVGPESMPILRRPGQSAPARAGAGRAAAAAGAGTAATGRLEDEDEYDVGSILLMGSLDLVFEELNTAGKIEIAV